MFEIKTFRMDIVDKAKTLSEDTRLFIGSIRRIETPNTVVFLREYILQSRPVILTDVSTNWRAMKCWDFDYLTNVIKDNMVSIAVTPDGLADAVVNGAFQLPEERTMSFSEFMKKVKNPGDEIFYLQKQNNCLREEYPELAKDVPPEISFFSEALGTEPDAINLWIGGEKSMSSLHRDPYENLYTVIRGQKRFVIYPPTDRVYMKYESFPVVRLKLVNGSWSRVAEPDLESVQWIAKKPEIEPYEVLVNPGETLYLPAGWFHQVYQSDKTIAVNYWYDRIYDQSYTKETFVNSVLESL